MITTGCVYIKDEILKAFPNLKNEYETVYCSGLKIFAKMYQLLMYGEQLICYR